VDLDIGSRFHLPPEKVDCCGGDLQMVAEVVRDSGGHQAKRREALGAGLRGTSAASWFERF
jgi:hypothetical protein